MINTRNVRTHARTHAVKLANTRAVPVQHHAAPTGYIYVCPYHQASRSSHRKPIFYSSNSSQDIACRLKQWQASSGPASSSLLSLSQQWQLPLGLSRTTRALCRTSASPTPPPTVRVARCTCGLASYSLALVIYSSLHIPTILLTCAYIHTSHMQCNASQCS